MLFVKFLLATFAYAVVTVMLFGNPFQPIALATLWSSRLGAPYWQGIAIISFAASTLIFLRPIRDAIPTLLREPVFLILAVLLPTAAVGLYADGIRHRTVLALHADEVEEHSFFRSIREAPADFQFFLHTAALKGCTPYAWSYRKLAFYVLPPNIAVNVLPQQWITRCGIVRN
jgi:hypothetical protein